MIFFMTFVFGLMKFEIMVTRQNPIINTNTDILEHGTTFNTADNDFMVAIALADYSSARPLTDPRFVRFYLRHRGRIEDESVTVNFPLSLCQQDDINRFYPPANVDTENKVNKLIDDKNLFCIDRRHFDYEIFGTWKTGGDY